MDLQAKEIQQQINNCIAHGDYETAENLKNELINFKTQIKNEINSVLLSDHQTQTSAINQAYNEEIIAFNDIWNARLDEFNLQSQNKLENLKSELQQALLVLEEQFQQKPLRFSARLLSCRQAELKLAKSGDFQAAKSIQREADNIEIRERNEYISKQQFDKENQRLKLVQKFEKSGKVLKQKVECARDEILSAWALDMDRIEKHWQAMLRMEKQKFGESKQVKIEVGSGKMKINSESKIGSYISQKGYFVDSSQVGSSMSPVLSGSYGLGALRESVRIQD